MPHKSKLLQLRMRRHRRRRHEKLLQETEESKLGRGPRRRRNACLSGNGTRRNCGRGDKDVLQDVEVVTGTTQGATKVEDARAHSAVADSEKHNEGDTSLPSTVSPVCSECLVRDDTKGRPFGQCAV